MTETIIRVLQDTSGRVHFSTDIPAEPTAEERFKIVSRVVLGMISGLGGRTVASVNAAIRHLGFAAIMCSSTPEQSKHRFRRDEQELGTYIRNMIKNMRQRGLLVNDPKG